MLQIKETITQRKDGRYMGRFIIDYESNGKPVYQYVYGKTYDEAEQKLRIARDIESQYLSGRHITVQKVYTEWLNAIVNRVKESTYANYTMKFEKHILPVFGDMLCTAVNSAKINAFIRDKMDSGLSAGYVRDLMTVETRPEISLDTNASFNHTSVHNRKFWYSIIKRIGDVFFSLLALVLLSPFLIIVSILIFLEDRHNPFYVQDRVGLNGRVFRMYKFRTMRVNSHEQRNELLSQNEDQGANFMMTNDPRVTKIGVFLRKFSIDELLQLFNILKSDMSIIGPRPFIPEEQAELPSDRLLVKPGLSCYWQIGGKNSLSKEEQIELDRKYIRECSIGTDVKIVFRTIIHVLSGKNG